MLCCPAEKEEASTRLLSEPVLKNRKIVVTGFPGVGKSCVVIQFVENHFTQSYNPTIAASFHKTFKLRGQEFHCEILDTAGQDEFTPFPQSLGVGIHGYVLVYSVASSQSFERIPVLNDKILDVCGCDSVPRILVGNKTDLVIERQVSVEEGRSLAQELGIGFIECSAKHNVHVVDIFKQLLTEIESQQGAPIKEEETTCAIL